MVPVEEVACSSAMEGNSQQAPQEYAYPEQNCVPGLFGSDPRMFGFVNPVQPGFWSEMPPQEAWAPTPPTELAQTVTSPSIQGDSDRRSSTVDRHGNNLLSCSGISDPLNAVPNISDAMTGAAFTMTCPIPHCYFQCQTVVDMWKHLTWSHVRPNSKESGIESIVERVVLGKLS